MCATRKLQVHAASETGPNHVSPWGGNVAFRSGNFEGTIFFGHKPPADSSQHVYYTDRLNGKGPPDWLWEIQVQGRFRTQPQGTVWLSCELRDGPMRLGLVSRALCKAILKFVKLQVQKRGCDLRYCFGDQAGECPSIMVPVLAIDRIFVSDGPLPLPVGGSETKGTWRYQDGGWMPIERSSVTLDTSSYVTFAFATAYIDWSGWSLANLPGLGTLSLETFWGNQGCWVAFCDEPGGAAKPHRYLLEVSMAAPECVAEESGSSNGHQQHAMHKDTVDPDEAADAPADSAAVEVKETNIQEADVEAEVFEGEEALDEEDARRGLESTIHESGIDGDDAFLRSLSATSSMTVPDERESLGPTCTSAFSQEAAFASHLTKGEEDIHRALDTPSRPLVITEETLPLESSVISVPWYFRSGAGTLWWGIAFGGRLCWRHHRQLQDLCKALDAKEANLVSHGAVRDLECSRRAAERLLNKGRALPDLIEEFTSMEVDLASLLCEDTAAEPPRTIMTMASVGANPSRVLGEFTHKVADKVAEKVATVAEYVHGGDTEGGSVQGDWLGVVECEGRIVERYVSVKTPANILQWHCKDVSLNTEVSVDLANSAFEESTVAGLPALVLTAAHRQFMFITRRGAKTCWLLNSIREACREAAASVGTPPSGDSLPPSDFLRRWPKNRLVLNDCKLCVEPASEAPLSLSAQLLREAVGAQTSSRSSVQELTRRSAQLKCIDLSACSAQEQWAFWMNVTHCLLVHAVLLYGPPKALRELVGFYNSFSYVVAGHVFSLAELEHNVLRGNMTKPRFRFFQFFLKVWRRSPNDLENRPGLAAPRCPASAFKCRADWRLNLVLSAGNWSSSDKLPVFEEVGTDRFEDIVQRAMARTLECAGRIEPGVSIELPRTLYRYRDDAPGDDTAMVGGGCVAMAGGCAMPTKCLPGTFLVTKVRGTAARAASAAVSVAAAAGSTAAARAMSKSTGNGCGSGPVNGDASEPRQGGYNGMAVARAASAAVSAAAAAGSTVVARAMSKHTTNSSNSLVNVDGSSVAESRQGTAATGDQGRDPEEEDVEEEEESVDWVGPLTLSSERRWARALGLDETLKLSYCRGYRWQIRDQFYLLE